MNTLLTSLMFLLMMAAPVIAAGSRPDPLTLLTCAICHLLCLATGGDRNRLAHYFFLVFLYLALYPFHIQYVMDIELAVIARSISPMSLRSFAALNLFLLSVAAGTFALPTVYAPVQLSDSRKRTYLNKRFTVSFLVLLLACSMAIVGLGPDSFFSTRSSLYQQEARPGWLVMLIHIIRTVPCWFAFFLVWRALAKRQSLLKPRYFLLVLLILAFNNPVTAPRFIALTGLFLIAMPFLVARNHLRRFEFWFPLLVWSVLPVTSLMRAGLGRINLSSIQQIALSSLEFSTIRVFNDWMSGEHDHPMALGIYTVSAIFVFLPRALWLDKAKGTGMMLAQESGYSFTNVGVPPLTEFYLDFGWLGVFLGGLVIGHLLKRFGRLEANRFNFFSTLSCLPALLYVLIPILVRGDLGTFFVVFYSFVISHRFAAIVVRLRVSSNRTESGQALFETPGTIDGPRSART